ncbi:putative aldouronate transport system substrate-binding protein [Paenibacillus sp. UNCCL117]|uniref:extracellular solute-binding protein n=1 Tax=unclassified Paenibacillus TaxID=185978 RepID=UPI00088A23E3|nr:MULTISPECIES: extracellular solute-binding protein [unclassified Paenibacillus]SDC09198.1 carbohydrate ABC transporter substrate-binding protein, CUT1 family [Paenibacillus sp. cl123]SFW38407.1 putative aldouronate transport system substrate-binding protein [Paenibacillus sp. UNCCL117]
MSTKRKAAISITMSITLAGGMLVGCAGGGNEEPKEAPPAGKDSGQAAQAAYPASVTYWAALNANAAATMKSFGEIAAYQELEKRTGTKVEFQHPPVGMEKDQFNLMIATSSKLPDVIEYNWNTVSKGPDNAIKEKKIIRLNELIDQHAPNLKKYLSENPMIKKAVTTDEGNIYVFPFIRGDDYLLTFHGPSIRQDWLDKLKLPMPKTVAEWEETLRAFRDKDPNGNGKPDEIPFLLSMGDIEMNHAFVGAWGITAGFYQKDGKVQYGPIQPEYKEFLMTMNRWYKEGLIDKDYATVDAKLRDAKVTGDQLGALMTYSGSGIGRYEDLAKSKIPSFKLVGTPYPTLKAGDKPILGQKDQPFTGIGSAVTSAAKNPEQIVKWLDYKYGTEGHMLFNFGVEGTSYTQVNGYPTYTDAVLKNPDKLPVAQAIAKYALASFSGPFIQDKRYMEQFAAKQEQKNAISVWMQPSNERLMPTVTMTSEEGTKFASIMNDVKTYNDEMVAKFIMGSQPLDNFETYTKTLRSMGIEEAIRIQQSALERYTKR